MKKKNFKKITLGRQNISIILCVLLIITSFLSIVVNSKTINNENLSYTFLFLEPKIRETSFDGSDYSLIDMTGCISIGKQAGQPLLPVKIVKILIPPMKSVTNVQVVGDPVNVDLNSINLVEKPVFPYQNPVPIGASPGDFIVDYNIYSTNAICPGILKDEYHIGYSHGYAILDVTLNPLQYNPVIGELKYYPEMTVNIELKDNEYVNTFYRYNIEDKSWVQKLVYNPEIADFYTSDLPTFDYPGGLCDSSENYDYVIITTEQGGLDYWETSSTTPYNWDSLMDKHESDDGLSCTLVTKQEIDACTDYHNSDPLFNDGQAHIREFCKDAYQDWGTSYILIGGDGESNYIPARDMDYSYESDVDADIYWSNLDNNFNADHDSKWGEEGDSGFDLYTEIFIGRLTCDIPQDVSNWMTKSFYYADSVEDTYMDNAAFYGGTLGWTCEGDDFIDYGAIKGTSNWLGPIPGEHGAYPSWLGFQYGFETWNSENVGNEFNLSVAWTSNYPPNPGWQGGSGSAAINGLKTAINNDKVTLISAVAHADASKSMDVYSSDWESQYHNTKPFLIHDWGCHCGDFDAADDGVLHSMLFHSDTELAFACVYNTGYGWGSFYDTNSSSALQQKCFWDYMFDVTNKSGDLMNWQLGEAMAFSKDEMAPTINWSYSSAPGSWRGIIEGCLLFGDPAQRIKTPHPSEPPQTPNVPSGPGEWIQNLECTFYASTTDPEGDSIYYLFDWGDGNFSEWAGPFASGETGHASHIWSDLGNYEIKVRARDAWGAVSDWSETFMLSIISNTEPDKPLLNGPRKGALNQELSFKISAIDPNDHDVYYLIFWGDDNNTGWNGPYSSGQEVELNHTWTSLGEFTVLAVAKDFIGDQSDSVTLKINIPRNRVIKNPLLLMLLERLYTMFPMLKQLLRL